jgi:hypothetical protein
MADEENEVVVEEEQSTAKPPKKGASKASSSTSEVSPVEVPAKNLSFEQWASRRGIRSHHRGGLRAYVSNVSKHRTLEEWDECFRGY